MAIRPLEKDVPLNKCKKWEIEVYKGGTKRAVK